MPNAESRKKMRRCVPFHLQGIKCNSEFLFCTYLSALVQSPKIFLENSWIWCRQRLTHTHTILYSLEWNFQESSMDRRIFRLATMRSTFRWTFKSSETTRIRSIECANMVYIKANEWFEATTTKKKNSFDQKRKRKNHEQFSSICDIVIRNSFDAMWHVLRSKLNRRSQKRKTL